MPDRRCRTGEVLPAIAIVFGRHELDHVAISKGGANSVGTRGGFAPVTSRYEVDAGKSAANSCIANHIQETTFGITQHHDVPGSGEEVRETVYYRARGAYEQFIGLAHTIELGLPGDSERCTTPRGIDMHGVAALPGVQDH